MAESLDTGEAARLEKEDMAGDNSAPCNWLGLQGLYLEKEQRIFGSSYFILL